MKKSLFNFYVTGNNNEKIIYNSYSGKQVKFPINMESEYKDFLNNDYQKLSSKYIEILSDNGMLTNKDEIQEIKESYNQIIFGTDLLEITVLPTDACNFKCVYCYQSGPYHKMDENTANGLIEFVEENCSKYKQVLLGWFGGEPLIRKELVVEMTSKIKEICRKKGVAFVSRISTNGYELDIETAKKLINNSLLFYQITIDGTKEIHNYQRPHITNGNSYERIIENLKNIKNSIKASQLSIACRINVSAKNVEILDEFLDEFKRNFGDDKRFKVLVEPVHDWGGNIKDNKELVIDDMMSDIMSKFYSLVAQKGINTLMPTDFRRGALLCEAARKNSFVFNYNGDILKCTSAIYEKGDIPDLNIIGHIDNDGNYWVDSEREKLWICNKNKIYECEKCIGFPLCGGSGCVLAANVISENVCHNKKRIVSCIKAITAYNDIIGNYTEIRGENKKLDLD